MDFLHIGYCDQVQSATDAHKIEFGSVPNLCNYGNFSYILSVSCDISEKTVVILFIFGTVIRYHALHMLGKWLLALCHTWVLITTFSYILCVCYITEKSRLLLLIFGTVIRDHVLLMHVKYSLVVCQIWVIIAIFFLNLMYLLRYLRKECIDLFTFATLINHSRDLMHVKYTLALYQNIAFMSIIS